ncbi:MAG: translation elongation factor Ts [Proteobacteria bacterium]|jgi:elongation factor Ts|nr:translation elongation factor Ts [Pseudomonadota bacterium]MCG6935777.1 translation elongation factor Ts [Pseudomonadota bacterium]
MAITAAMVKELRERTGAGMMECKKALVETEGDINAAIELMRKSGMAKADKKAGRTAAEGLVAIKLSDDGKTAAIVEVNCETDFVTKGEDFKNFVDAVARQVLDKQPSDLDTLLAMSISNDDDTSVEDTRKTLIAKIGENMNVRRFDLVKAKGQIATYMHGNRIGVVVDLEGGEESLGKDLAMHIAASHPVCVSEAEVPADVIKKEKEIFSAQAAESGKPADIIEKMVDGRIKKFLKEVTLLGQPFVKDPDQTVEKLLSKSGAKVSCFVRYEVGEGIEKKQENFADEVMAQMKG